MVESTVIAIGALYSNNEQSEYGVPQATVTSSEITFRISDIHNLEFKFDEIAAIYNMMKVKREDGSVHNWIIAKKN